MGSLQGHILPGSFFLVFGLWWTWSIFHRYFLSKKNYHVDGLQRESRKSRFIYKNSASFPCYAWHTIPVEGLLKVLLTSIGMIGEFATAFEEGNFTHFSNVHHITMYWFFWINGLADTLVFHRKAILPDLDYVTGILAYFVQGFLFLYHLDSMNEMEFRVHVFLIYLIFATAIACIIEMINKNSVWAALNRVFFVLLQGIWFYQIGLILYVYRWDPKSHNRMEMVTFVYICHFAAVFIFLLIAGYLIRWKVMHLAAVNSYRQSSFSQERDELSTTNEEILDLIFTECEEL